MHTTWSDSGQKLSEVSYLHGEANGLSRIWYEDGTLRRTGGWLDGKEHGHWITFYPNGRKLSEGAALRGERVGRWTFWADDGTIEAMGEYLPDGRYRAIDGVRTWFSAPHMPRRTLATDGMPLVN